MKNRKLWSVLALVIFLCSAWNLLEGGFHLSTAKEDQLEPLMTGLDGAIVPPMAQSRTEDVMVALCENREGGVYILEFAKNTVFNRYSLREAHRWYGREPFTTVASSAIRNYPYEVDMQTHTVTIEKGSLRNTLWNDVMTLILSLLALGIYPFRRKKQ